MTSKFNSPLAERLYQRSLEGAQTDTIGSVDELGWCGRFNDELAILFQDEQGFVWADVYDTPAKLELAWTELVRAYVEWDEQEVV